MEATPLERICLALIQNAPAIIAAIFSGLAVWRAGVAARVARETKVAAKEDAKKIAAQVAEVEVKTAQNVKTAAAVTAGKLEERVAQAAKSLSEKVERKHAEMVGLVKENTALTEKTAEAANGLTQALVKATGDASFLAGETSAREEDKRNKDAK